MKSTLGMVLKRLLGLLPIWAATVAFCAEDPGGITIERFQGINYLTVVNPNAGRDGHGSIVRINPKNGAQTLVTDNSKAHGMVFVHPTGIAFEARAEHDYLVVVDPDAGSDGLGAVIRVNPSNESTQLISDNTTSRSKLFVHPTAIVEEANNGTDCLVILNSKGGQDGRGSVVRINPQDHSTELVAENPPGKVIFVQPTAIGVERLADNHSFIVVDPKAGLAGNGAVFRVNSKNKSIQLISDNSKNKNVKFQHPFALAMEMQGGTYYPIVINPGNGVPNGGSLLRVNPDDGSTELISNNKLALGNFGQPTSVTAETFNNTYYLTTFDTTQNSITRFPSTGPQKGTTVLVATRIDSGVKTEPLNSDGQRTRLRYTITKPRLLKELRAATPSTISLPSKTIGNTGIWRNIRLADLSATIDQKQLSLTLNPGQLEPKIAAQSSKSAPAISLELRASVEGHVRYEYQHVWWTWSALVIPHYHSEWRTTTADLSATINAVITYSAKLELQNDKSYLKLIPNPVQSSLKISTFSLTGANEGLKFISESFGYIVAGQQGQKAFHDKVLVNRIVDFPEQAINISRIMATQDELVVEIDLKNNK